MPTEGGSTATPTPLPEPARPVVKTYSGNSILVNKRQKGNQLLEVLKSVAWEYATIPADYQVGATTGAFYLSLRYHRLHPEYLHNRIKDLGSSYKLRHLIFHMDAKDPENEIKELTKVCMINEITILTVETFEQAATYLATYKLQDGRGPSLIMERIDTDYTSILRNALTSIKSVNKTDVTTMRTNLGDLAAMSRATYEELNELPGFGKVKARRVFDAFNKPFRSGARGAHGVQARKTAGATVTADKGKGKEKEVEVVDDDMPTAEEEAEVAAASGAFSPDWDIELDLNPESDHGGQVRQNASITVTADKGKEKDKQAEETMPTAEDAAAARAFSPDWDIELDLNLDSDEEAISGGAGAGVQATPGKTRRPNPFASAS